jgi:hypothetical protein
MSIQSKPSTLTLAPRTLVFFIDDTGHELLNDPTQKVFGLGGCAIMSELLETNVRKPWREVRRAITGNENNPLHAADVRNPNQQQIDAVAQFFKTQPIGRFGAICSVETDFNCDLTPLRTVAEILKQRIIEIAKWQPFDSVTIIFEHSERLEQQIENVFPISGLKLMAGLYLWSCAGCTSLHMSQGWKSRIF